MRVWKCCVNASTVYLECFHFEIIIANAITQCERTLRPEKLWGNHIVGLKSHWISEKSHWISETFFLMEERTIGMFWGQVNFFGSPHFEIS